MNTTIAKKPTLIRRVKRQGEFLRLGAFRIPIIKRVDLDDCYGQYRPLPDPRIEYNGCTGATKASTLFHEMLHFISDQYEIDLTETQVRILEHTVPQLIRENPVAFSDLLE